MWATHASFNCRGPAFKQPAGSLVSTETSPSEDSAKSHANIEAKVFGESGHRSRYLSHAKRALYHLS